MSDTQCTNDCSRSASDSNLADVEDGEFVESDNNVQFADHVNTQMSFTLPRWMSKRRKSKNKVKYVKIDVLLNVNKTSKDVNSDAKKIQDKPNFLTKLFRRNSFTNSTSSKITKSKSAKISISHLLSSSNTDIGSSNVGDILDHEYFKDRTPSVCGLKNHGNTCFMNAVIQCLNNTECFSEYFVMDHYRLDLLHHNKTHSKKFGTRGEVTEQLAALLKSLWSCQYYPDISNKFKTLVGKYGMQYEGSNQHDAQEFLLWLLDKVHEDLNTATKQKYRKPKRHYGCADEVIAAETLANHLRCNNSFIHDLFQGQFRSSLCCHGCGCYSNTFDPYLCVSPPVPHYQTVSVFLHLVLLNEKVKMTKVGISMDSQATLSDLCDSLSSSFCILKQSIIFTEFSNGEFQRTFNDTDQVTILKDNQCIYALEMPHPKPVKNEGETLVLIVANRLKNADGENELFWRPVALEVYREIAYTDLQKQILSAMSGVVKESVDENLFSLLVMADSTEVLPSTVDLPLYMPVVDHALQLTSQKHLKIYADWEEQSQHVLIKDIPFVEEHSSVSSLKNMEKKPCKVSLYECFDLYFTEEKLGAEDAWMCPYCRRRLPCIKQLCLWSLPDVFIVHLKRFRQSFCQRTKITTFVEFPLSGLDMNAYVAARNPTNSVPLNSIALWRRLRSRSYARWDDNVYDLYAVCNHHGSMQGGHYTACCKNPVDGRWYLFDDTQVQEVEAGEVGKADAYLLFYQRSSASSCASSSTSGYSSASEQRSKSHDNLYSLGNTASLDRRSTLLNRPFTRGSKVFQSMGKKEPRKAAEVPQCSESLEKIPPPPPAKHYWTVTSV